jgi:hypothetical protein
MSVKILLHPRFAELVQLSSTMKRCWKREGRWEARVRKGLASGVRVLHWDVGHRPIRVHVRCLRIEDEAEEIGYIL